MSLTADSDFILICSALILQADQIRDLEIKNLRSIVYVISMHRSADTTQQRHKGDGSEDATFKALLASRQAQQLLLALRTDRDH